MQVCRCPADNKGGINCATSCPVSSVAGSGLGDVCNGHGECRLSTATCACQAGWQGNNCTAECPNGAEYPCNYQGDCKQEGAHGAKCSCYAGFRGDNCTIECKGGAASPCNNHGNCEVDGTCTCLGGWRGTECEIECPGGSLVPCHGHGVCQTDATCLCNALYRGKDCCMQCPDLLGVPCAGRGLCTLRDDVTCNAAFYSAELVPGEERVNPNQAQCKCNRGFRGADCQIECYGGAGSECSGHGTCLDDGNCTCELGWVGLACNILCPGTSVDSPLPCNGHGSCTGVMLAGVNSSGGRGTCGGGCYQSKPGEPARCNCQNGLQGVVAGYAGAACEKAVYSTLVRVSADSVSKPHIKAALLVEGLSKTAFTPTDQALFLKGTAQVLLVDADKVVLDSVEDVLPADLSMAGATSFLASANASVARRLLQAAQAFDVQKVVVTVRVLLKGNEETQDMAAKLKTAVQEGSLVKAIETLGLKVRGCACVARGEGRGGSGRCTSVSSPVELTCGV